MIGLLRLKPCFCYIVKRMPHDPTALTNVHFDPCRLQVHRNSIVSQATPASCRVQISRCKTTNMAASLIHSVVLLHGRLQKKESITLCFYLLGTAGCGTFVLSLMKLPQSGSSTQASSSTALFRAVHGCQQHWKLQPINHSELSAPRYSTHPKTRTHLVQCSNVVEVTTLL